MPVPEFILHLRERIGHDLLWLPAVTAVVVHDDGSVLLVRRADTGAWTPVTGIIDPGEEPAVAAEREVLEEAGLVVVADRLTSTGVTAPVQYPNGDVSQYVDLTFRCRWVSGDPHPADGENTAARWCAPGDLPPMADEMLARVEAALADEREARFRR